MKRLIFVPQLPIHMRYQEWWMTELEKKFKKHFDIITLGKSFLRNKIYEQTGDSFSSVEHAIELEQCQINQYLELDIQKDDILFLTDISFPGFFPNVLHHKPIKNAFAFCHGTSLNNWDYFRCVRDSKHLVERGQAAAFKKIFVATNYHKDKLDWGHIEVVGVPKSPFKTYKTKIKKFDLVSVARNDIQKRDNYLEYMVEERFGLIKRMKFFTWENYYRYLSLAKIMIITAREETFGYQVMDAVMNHCIPIAPNKFSYPELLPRDYLYDNEKEMFEKIDYYLKHPWMYPKQLLNQSLVDNFYNNIINQFNR